MLVFYYHVNLIAGSLHWAYIEGCWNLDYAPFPRSHTCYHSQISILVTNMTIQQVLTDGYRLALHPVGLSGAAGAKGMNLLGVQLPVQATDSAVAAMSD